jgi:hypothetical protein
VPFESKKVPVEWVVQSPGCGFLSPISELIERCKLQRSWWHYEVDERFRRTATIRPDDLQVLREQLERQLQLVDELQKQSRTGPDGE